MRITCKKSGIQWDVPCFPSFNILDQVHPIFTLPQRTLFAQLRPFTAGSLDELSQVLLFLALLDSTNAIEWRNPFSFTDDAISVIQGNLHKTASAVYKLNEIISPSFETPRFACSKHGAANTAMGLMRAVEMWEGAIDEWTNGKRQVEAGAKLLRIEQVLERLLRLQQRKPEAFSKTLANWAVLAAEFPTTNYPMRGGVIRPTAEYWHEVIQRCVLNKNLISIPADDLIDLIEYCEEEIPHGSIYAATLMTILRSAVRKQREFLGLPAHKGIRVFTVVPATMDEQLQHDKEMSILKQMALAAPKDKPMKADFANPFLFIRALARWEAAQGLLESGTDLTSTEPSAPVAEPTNSVQQADYE